MRFYQVDSFTDKLFGGNPAGVCLVGENWPSEELMQNIAAENNLSETAFVKQSGKKFGIRWFTPTVEVPLCGHGTLAAAHVMFCHEGFEGELVFDASGRILRVVYDGDLLTLDFPADKIWQISFEKRLDCFNFTPKEVWRGAEEYLLVFDNQNQIEEAVCSLEKAAAIDLLGFIITAKADGSAADFVSRYFGPKIGINEDPVTGSAHTLLVPYWSGVLKKDDFKAVQLSKRRGQLFCRLEGDRVKIGGRAVTYCIGEIQL